MSTELNRILRNYRTTLLEKTDHSFVRSMKSKLPKLIKLDADVEMRQYDRTTEVKKKRHPDSEWYVNH